MYRFLIYSVALPAGTAQSLAGTLILNGFEENVISGQRSIRIFGKLFMETEMTSILVQGVGPEQKKVVFFKNHDFVNRKSNSKFQAFCCFAKNLVVFSCSGPTPYTKMLVISLSINNFPKNRMLRWPDITFSSNPSRKRSPDRPRVSHTRGTFFSWSAVRFAPERWAGPGF